MTVATTSAQASSTSDRRVEDPEEAGTFALPADCYESNGAPELGACRLLPHRRGAPTLVVWGDSHAREMLTGIVDAIGTNKVNLIAYIAGGCPPVDPGHPPEVTGKIAAGCEKHNALAVRDLTRMSQQRRSVQVVVAAGWELYRNALHGQYGRWQTYGNDYIRQTARLTRTGTSRLFRTMQKIGIATHVVGQAPMIPDNAPACKGAYNEPDPVHPTAADYAYLCRLPRSTVMVAAGLHRRYLRSELGKLTGANRGFLLQPADHLCRDGQCIGVARGAEVWRDPVHISTQSSARLKSMFVPVVRSLLRAHH